MSLIEAIILGIIQGLTEFIPVSSSGHLVIGQHIFSGASDHLFLEWINLGTFIALLVYFRHRLYEMWLEVVRDHNWRLFRNIMLTAIPAGAVGFLASDFIAKTAFFGSIYTVIVTLLVVGVLMIVLERLPKSSPVKGGEKLSPLRALTIGVVQVLALIPGVSRSGSTIITGRFMGLSAREAAEYSFLASLPIMLGVTLKLLLSSSDRAYLMDNLVALSAGNIAAFVSGLLAVGLLMQYLSRHSLAIFGWYRVALATVVLGVVLVQ